MVTELQELMRRNVAAPPPDSLDIAALVADGQRRVSARRRRRGAAGAAMLAVAAVVTAAALVVPGGTDHADPADHPPAPDGPTLGLADAHRAVEGRDYTELASYTNENLDRDNGQYFDGVTDDGLILFRDGPRMDQLRPRFALMDPATGDKDWLPQLEGVGQDQTWPVELGADRIVLLSLHHGLRGDMRAHVFDRSTGEWTTLTWPGLPAVDFPRAVPGPDDRLYVRVLDRPGKIPEGGWPMGPDGEADDADAEGDTYHLWSVSLTDTGDVRDEGLTVGDVAFTDTSMVWTDSTNGEAGMVHVRDLASDEEHSFDPHAGERCNLLGFGATGDRIVMSEYCGTYADSVRDDRVQILSTDGDQVVTIQDSGIDGFVAGSNGSGDLVTIESYWDGTAGTYVYDPGSDRFLRISDGVGKFGVGGSAPAGQFLWSTPVNHRYGITQRLGELSED